MRDVGTVFGVVAKLRPFCNALVSCSLSWRLDKFITHLFLSTCTCFPRPKDKPPALQCRGVVYRIACVDCNFVYYGQTDRALETRLKEHKRAVRVGDNNSKVAQHVNQFVHSTDCDHATIVDRARNFHERLFLEAWYSQRDSNAGNEHIDIPDVYKSLA